VAPVRAGAQQSDETGKAVGGGEEINPRARALYERLGYVAYSPALESWDEEAADGSIFRYETMCTLMRKGLS
jgi:hypothetical protein